jgi:hypothetical protein
VTISVTYDEYNIFVARYRLLHMSFNGVVLMFGRWEETYLALVVGIRPINQRSPLKPQSLLLKCYEINPDFDLLLILLHVA